VPRRTLKVDKNVGVERPPVAPEAQQVAHGGVFGAPVRGRSGSAHGGASNRSAGAPARIVRSPNTARRRSRASDPPTTPSRHNKDAAAAKRGANRGTPRPRWSSPRGGGGSSREQTPLRPSRQPAASVAVAPASRPPAPACHAPRAASRARVPFCVAQRQVTRAPALGCCALLTSTVGRRARPRRRTHTRSRRPLRRLLRVLVLVLVLLLRVLLLLGERGAPRRVAARPLSSTRRHKRSDTDAMPREHIPQKPPARRARSRSRSTGAAVPLKCTRATDTQHNPSDGHRNALNNTRGTGHTAARSTGIVVPLEINPWNGSYCSPIHGHMGKCSQRDGGVRALGGYGYGSSSVRPGTAQAAAGRPQ